MVAPPDPRDCIDIARYPIDRPDAPAYADLVERCTAAMAATGCISLPGFLRAGSVPPLAAEIAALQHEAFYSDAERSPYGTPGDPADWPDGHPRRVMRVRTAGFICADRIPDDSALWALYRWDALAAFLEKAFGRSPLHRYADPLACMPVNVMAPGQSFPWHFDSNEFTVTVMLQPAEGGGAFEYVPFIRGPEDENYAAVGDILAGGRTGVHTLPLAAGDLQLFKGRYTLHRVTEVTGDTTRLVATPSFSTQPDMVGPPHRMLSSYGRVLPIHFERAGLSPDAHAQ